MLTGAIIVWSLAGKSSVAETNRRVWIYVDLYTCVYVSVHLSMEDTLQRDRDVEVAFLSW